MSRNDYEPDVYDEAEVYDLFDALTAEDDNVAIDKVTAETGLTRNQVLRFRQRWAGEGDSLLIGLN